MMIPIYSRRDKTNRSRHRILIGGYGITMTYERPSVTGGYLTRNSVTIPWPWVKIS